MSPRAGGEADKFGNRYEGAWTVRHLLYCLHGSGDSITVEDTGDLAEGVEFTYRHGEVVEVHQLKRQHGTANSWSVRLLRRQGIWQNARIHVEAGRAFHFISVLPSFVLQELCDNARRSRDLQAFTDNWLTNKKLRDAFAELSSSEIYGSAGAAWETVRGIWIRWSDELELSHGNAVLADLLLDGAAGSLAAVGLGDLVLQNLGVELTAASIYEKLPVYGLSRATSARGVALREEVDAITSRWMAATERELLQPAIPRDEAVQIVAFAADDRRVCFVIGAAGGGKSAVLHQAVADLQTADTPVLAVRLDRLEPFSSTTELGDRLGLPISPVAALASVAGERRSVLVIDQLDAVSLASGRMPNTFDAVADLVRESSAFPQMHVVLACRKFDADNDHRIRQLSARPDTSTVSVNPLSDEQVDRAVATMSLDPSRLTPHQRALLRSPLNLVLLASAANGPNALDFQTTSHLFDAFWERKRRDVLQRRAATRFGQVVVAVAIAISQRQRLTVPVVVLDRDDLTNDADVLVSEHLLVRDGQQIAFFHEAFFDYAFARQWVNQSESLVEFLVQGEQELFRRAQVRQIMTYLREVDASRFVREVEALLANNRVRFHIKDVALAVLGSLADPTSAELQMVLGATTRRLNYEERQWRHLRTPAWFARFDADGVIDRWLAGDNPEWQSRAQELMASAAKSVPDRLAELLNGHKAHPDYESWLKRIIRFSDLYVSRPLFDLFLEAVRTDVYAAAESELWLGTRGLAERQPTWAVELLVAILVERPNALALDDTHKVIALTGRDHGAAELARRAASAAPRQFCDALLPYMLRVMELTRSGHNRPGLPGDRHFFHQHPGLHLESALDEALLVGMTSAIRSLAAEDAEAARPTLELLAAQKHDAAQWLLYQGLLAGRDFYVDWAAELLLEDTSRLFCGYASNSVWVTRLLLQQITPALNDEVHRRLEAAVRDLRFPWEKGRPFYAFTLLSALDERRLSEVGRRRLGEYRRLFEVEQPPEPQGVRGGVIGSPIPEAAAQHMSDDNWLSAMRKHGSDRTNWSNFTGGAHELSQVLREQVKQDPTGFARLARRVTNEINPAYGDAILMGLGDAAPLDNPEVIFEAILHIASFGHAENDRWIGWSLRPYYKVAPLALVELVRDRALQSADPADEGSSITSGGTRRAGAELHMAGMNTARGSLAEALGDLLVYDVDGSRTELVAPMLGELAEDPAVVVRGCAAHTIAAAMRHARPEAIAAFWQLIDTDDVILTADAVHRLMIFIGDEDSAAVMPVVERMLASAEPDVRQAGGQLACFAALEWGTEQLMQSVLNGDDVAARKGAAEVCAQRLHGTSNAALAGSTLVTLFEDNDASVRATAAEVAGTLRGQHLRPYEHTLMALIGSSAFTDALPQLLLTLQYAPDRVDDLALASSQRFVKVFENEAGDIRTSAAGEAGYVSELVVRGLAQSRSTSERSALLDVLDELLRIGAYGIDEAIDQAER